MSKSDDATNQKYDTLPGEIHYLLNQESYGIHRLKVSDRWSNIRKTKITLTYDIADNTMLLNNTTDQAIFHSGDQLAFLDEELMKLTFKPSDCLLECNLIVTESPSVPLFILIMTYPKMEAAGAILIITGLIALTVALIALIPAVSTALALIGISSATIAIAGGILFAIGLTMALTTRYCQNELNEAPMITSTDATITQIGIPESTKHVTDQTKCRLFSHFSIFENKDNEESEADFSFVI